jgi:hypothetical protein
VGPSVVSRIFAGRRLLSCDERPSHGLLRLTEVPNPKVQGVETLERDAPFDLCVGQFLLDFSEPPFNTPDAGRGVIHGGEGLRGLMAIRAGTPHYPSVTAARKRSPEVLVRRAPRQTFVNPTM